MFFINRLNVSYGESKVITDLDLELRKGEILAVMGRNGMGKTTLFKSLIASRWSPNSLLLLQLYDSFSSVFDLPCL